MTLLAALSSETDARHQRRNALDSIRNISFDGFNKHPRVQATSCTKTINRLKAGPADIPKVISTGTQFTDTDFSGADLLYGGNDDSRNTAFKNTVDSKLSSGAYFWKRWETQMPNANVMNA